MVLWIRDFRDDEIPLATLLSSLQWEVVGADNIRVSGYNLKTFLRMLGSVWRVIRQNDGILASTQAPVYSKVAFLFAKLQKKQIVICFFSMAQIRLTMPLNKA